MKEFTTNAVFAIDKPKRISEKTSEKSVKGWIMNLTVELSYIEQLTERILDNLEQQGINPLEAILYARYVLEELE